MRIDSIGVVTNKSVGQKRSVKREQAISDTFQSSAKKPAFGALDVKFREISRYLTKDCIDLVENTLPGLEEIAAKHHPKYDLRIRAESTDPSYLPVYTAPHPPKDKGDNELEIFLIRTKGNELEGRHTFYRKKMAEIYPDRDLKDIFLEDVDRFCENVSMPYSEWVRKHPPSNKKEDIMGGFNPVAPSLDARPDGGILEDMVDMVFDGLASLFSPSKK